MKQRIRFLIQQEKSQKVFAEKISLNDRTLSSYLNRDDSDLKVGTIESILKAYPNLNARWLISGEGDIWQSDAQTGPTPLHADAVEVLNYANRREVRLIEDIRVQAGAPSGEYLSSMNYQAIMVPGVPDGCIALAVVGSSMEPLMYEGDILIAEPWTLDKLNDAHIYIVELEQDGFTVKYASLNGRNIVLRYHSGKTITYPLTQVKKIFRVLKKVTNAL